MNIFWPESEQYFRDSEKVKKTFFTDYSGTINFFSEPVRAVFELSWALSRFVYHKKTVWFQSGFCPIGPEIVPSFYKDSYNVQMFPAEEFTDPEKFCAKLPRDIGFIYFAEDHPITGEVFDIQPVLMKLEEKRIYSVGVSYNAFRYRKALNHKYHLQVCHLSKDMILSFVGEKLKLSLPTAQFQKLNFFDIEKHLEKISSSPLPELAEVKSRIQSLNLDFKFLENSNSLKDRLLIYHPECHGESLVNQMLYLNSDKQIGKDRLVPLANCSMIDYRPLDHWWTNRPSPDVLRGCFVVDLHLANQDFFPSALANAFKSLTL